MEIIQIFIVILRKRKGNIMESETVELLKECNSGCKMARNSMEQIMEYIKDPKQADIINAYERKHQEIENKISELLMKNGEIKESPSLMASAMSWFTTEMKMSLHNNGKQAAKIMMDGCNMGIQSVTEYINKNQSASKESIQLAKDLVKIEEEFMQEMKQFL